MSFDTTRGKDEAPTKLDAFEKLEYDATLGHLRQDRIGSNINPYIRVEINNRSENSSLSDPHIPMKGLYILL